METSGIMGGNTDYEPRDKSTVPIHLRVLVKISRVGFVNNVVRGWSYRTRACKGRDEWNNAITGLWRIIKVNERNEYQTHNIFMSINIGRGFELFKM